MMRSLRRRLVLGTTAAMAVLYGVMSGVLYVAIERSLWKEFDGGLAVKARALAGLAEQGEQGVKLDVEPGQLGQEEAGEGFVLWNGEGQVAASSVALKDVGAVVPAGDGPGESYGFLGLPSGHRARYAAVRFQPRQEDEERQQRSAPRRTSTLVVMRDTAPLDRKLRELVWLLAGVCGVTVLASAGTMAWVIRRGLRPLGVLAERIHRMDESDLGERLALADAPAEIQPVVERLNDLLARLEASFVRERSFTADVAHELRTPLAGLITTLEVCGGQRRGAEEYERVMSRCLATSRGMRSMVENLLTLARADAGQLAMTPRAVDVGRMLREVWEPFAGRAGERGLQVAWSVGSPVEARTDEGLLEMVVRNVFDNAVSYTDEGGRIEIEGGGGDSGVVIRIRNTGSRVRPEDAGRVFDRFWRGDAARTGGGRHCGLGLALGERVTALLGGTIQAESAADGVFTVTVTLPRRT